MTHSSRKTGTVNFSNSYVMQMDNSKEPSLYTFTIDGTRYSVTELGSERPLHIHTIPVLTIVAEGRYADVDWEGEPLETRKGSKAIYTTREAVHYPAWSSHHPVPYDGKTVLVSMADGCVLRSNDPHSLLYEGGKKGMPVEAAKYAMSWMLEPDAREECMAEYAHGRLMHFLNSQQPGMYSFGGRLLTREEHINEAVNETEFGRRLIQEVRAELGRDGNILRALQSP